MSSIPFFSAHNHSTYSVYDGLGYPNESIDFALNNGLSGIAITDHGNMNGFANAHAHYKKLKKDNKLGDFKIVYGLESYFHPSLSDWREELRKHKEDVELAKNIDEDDSLVVEDEEESKKITKSLSRRHHLLLMAQNQKGLNNLFKMVSESYRGDNFYRYPRIDLDMLKKNNEGIIASTACLAGPLSYEYWKNKENGEKAILEAMEKTMSPLLEVFGDRIYGELQWHRIKDQLEVNKYIIELSKRMGFKLISTNDSHYPNPKLWKDREIYKALGWMNKKKDDLSLNLPRNLEDMACQLYPKNGDEVFAYYKKYSKELDVKFNDDDILESLANTVDISKNRIEKYEPDTTVKLPSFIVPEGQDADDLLRSIAIQHLKETGLYKNDDYAKRLNEELSIIKDRKFSKYFLTMNEMIKEGKQVQLLGPGRGSAGGSLLSYLLNITEVDPIKYNLQFERFIRRQAVDFPDIDVDFTDNMGFKEHLIKKWGENSVVPISNFNTLKIRSLIKDVSKLAGIEYSEVNQITTKMLAEATPAAKKDHDILAGVYDPTWDELKKYSPTLQGFLGKYPEVAAHIETLQGQIRSVSRHAGGVVIADDLNVHMPLIKSGGVTQTPWAEGQTVRHLEPLGLIKFDILGLKTLKIIESTIRRILRKQNKQEPTFAEVKKFYLDYLHPDKLKDDKNVYKFVFQEGNFCGTFQFTNSGMQNLCKRAKPNNVIDLSAVTSIYRPGPLCLSGDSEILISRNFYKGKKQSSWKTIKELYEQFSIHRDKNIKPLQIVSLDEKANKLFGNKIKNVVYSGKKPVYKIKTQRFVGSSRDLYDSVENNNKENPIIKATLQHRFFTKDGWKELKDIKEGEYICFLNKKLETKDKIRGHNKSGVFGKKNFRNIAFRNYEYRCVFCDWKNASLDVNHLDENRHSNNKAENLCFLCPNHHREFTENLITKEQIISSREKCKLVYNEDVTFVRYIGCEYIGDEETYDIEVEGPNHNFIAGNFVVHNSAHVDEDYVKNKEDPSNIRYAHPLVEEILKETYGFIIFQEQIASIAHKLGKDITLDEGNELRKVLTKKGTGKEAEVKNKLYNKFVDGCVEKGLKKDKADELWKTMEFFSGYGFNKSHAVEYSFITYQCAWLWYNYPDEWICSFLDEEDEKKKFAAIGLAKKYGYTVQQPEINVAGDKWEIKPGTKILVQPLTTIKGLGEVAIAQILKYRPFKTVEELLFHKEMSYSKVNKKALDSLCRTGALDVLIDKRFSGSKHFWSACVVDRPKNEKKLLENIEKYKPEGSFTPEEQLENVVSLSGNYPVHLVMSEKLIEQLENKMIPPISEFDPELQVCWGIPRIFEEKKTKNGKTYYVVSFVDATNSIIPVKLWSFNKAKDRIWLNKPYLLKPKKDDYGFSLSNTVGLKLLEM